MRTISTTLAVAFMFAAPFALAQTSPPPSEPSATPETQTPGTQTPGTRSPAPEAPAAEKPASPPSEPVIEPQASAPSLVPKLSTEEAKAWIDKPIYSSDQKNIGEVAVIDRSATGEVMALQADIGGFFGIFETRVRVDPSEFKLMQDRVVLNITADQANALPKIETR